MVIEQKQKDNLDYYANLLKDEYSLSDDKVFIDYDTNRIKIENEYFPLNKIMTLIDIATDGTGNPENVNKFQYTEKKYEKYYTIVDYRYFYIKNMADMGFSLYDIARYFQTSPRLIKQCIERIPDLNAEDLNTVNINNETFQLIAQNRDKYLRHELSKGKMKQLLVCNMDFLKSRQIKILRRKL